MVSVRGFGAQAKKNEQFDDNWVDQKVLREITQRQHDDRESYRA